MPEIYVGKEIIGKRLEKPVYSSYGGLLYPAGHLLREKDVEFLLAFKVGSISVGEEGEKEGKEELTKKREEFFPSKRSEGESSLGTIQLVMKEMDKALMQIMAGGSPPILEMRSWLKPLLDRADMSTGWIYAFQENH